jgi:alpha-tubulin suppressor-like RCC1 family protein
LEQKYSPVLVDLLLNQKLHNVSCGVNHTIVSTRQGDVFAWGSNESGQCGTTKGQKIGKIFAPQSVNFDQYYKP